ncbi:MAG: hypothetical protein IVW52_04760 [Acidimicrobiales bacterium]|nr:hypothetical protein [Acidimicrobiales bacterium]
MADISLGAEADASAANVSSLGVTLTGTQKHSAVHVSVGGASIVNNTVVTITDTQGNSYLIKGVGNSRQGFSLDVPGGDVTVTVGLPAADTNLTVVAQEVRGSGIVLVDNTSPGGDGFAGTTQGFGTLGANFDPNEALYMCSFWDVGAAPASYTNLAQVAVQSAVPGSDTLAVASGPQPNPRFGATFNMNAIYAVSQPASTVRLMTVFINVPPISGAGSFSGTTLAGAAPFGNDWTTFLTTVKFRLTNVPAGAAILVFFSSFGVAPVPDVTGISDTAGNTYTKLGSATFSSGAFDVWVARGVAAGAEVVVSVALSNLVNNTDTELVCALVVPATGGTLTLDATGAGSDGTTSVASQSVTTPITVAKANALLLAYFADQEPSTVWPALSGSLAQAAVAGSGVTSAFSVLGQQASAAGAQSPAAVVPASSSPWAAIAVAFDPSSTPTSTGPTFPQLVDQPCAAGDPAPVAQIVAPPSLETLPSSAAELIPGFYYDRCLDVYVTLKGPPTTTPP